MVELEPRVERELKYKRIGVDFDGPITLSSVPVRDELKRKFGIEFTEDDETDWDWIITTPKLNHLPLEEREKLNKEIWTNLEILRAARPRPGSLWALRALNKLGAELNFVTSREPKLLDVTHEYFQEWLPWVKPKQIHIRDERSSFGGIMLDGRMFKALVAQRLELEAFIEDDPQAAAILANTTRVFLMKSKLNEAFRNTMMHPSIVPVDGWVEAYKEIVGFKKYE